VALDSAIQNVGEYYAAHYLAEQFPKDIADPVKAWKAQGSQSVPRRLQALSALYFRAKSQALEYPDPQVRARARDTELRGWHSQLLAVLGYVPGPLLLELESEKQVLPALLRLHRHSRPWLAVLEVPFCLSDGEQAEEPLELGVQHGGAHEGGWPTIDVDWEKAVATLFKQENRPRWAVLLAGSRVYLFDAHTYARGRYLYVNLDDAFARKQAKTFESITRSCVPAAYAAPTVFPKNYGLRCAGPLQRSPTAGSLHGGSKSSVSASLASGRTPSQTAPAK
jgi:hypothetical protein